MTRPGIKRPPPPRKYPLLSMAVGATFTKTFADSAERNTFRNNVHTRGRQIGRKFQCVTDGLTLTVMRIG